MKKETQKNARFAQVKRETRHLREEERQILVGLYADCDHRELLLCLGGIVAHNTSDYVAAEFARQLIGAAANLTRKTFRSDSMGPAAQTDAQWKADRGLELVHSAVALAVDLPYCR